MTTPTLNGQVIGQAHYATRELLRRRLLTVDTSFEQSIVLNLLAVNGGSLPRRDLVDQVTFSLKVTPDVVEAAIEQLAARDLATAGDGVVLTPTGAELNDQIRASVAELTERLYGDLPEEERAVAGRVLATLTERANAELAATPGRTGGAGDTVST